MNYFIFFYHQIKNFKNKKMSLNSSQINSLIYTISTIDANQENRLNEITGLFRDFNQYFENTNIEREDINEQQNNTLNNLFNRIMSLNDTYINDSDTVTNMVLERSREDSYPKKNIEIKNTKIIFKNIDESVNQEYNLKSKKCPICIDKFNIDTTVKNNIIAITECEHIYHKKCIEDWCKEGNNCPVCRKNL